MKKAARTESPAESAYRQPITLPVQVRLCQKLPGAIRDHRVARQRADCPSLSRVRGRHGQ